jgi:hypothetical protein
MGRAKIIKLTRITGSDQYLCLEFGKFEFYYINQ